MTNTRKGFKFTPTDKDKRIAELEKENAEYKELFGDCSTCKRTCDMGNCCNPRTKNGYLLDKVKVIAERQKLLKENAVLHSKIGCYQKGMATEINKRDIKITEAKEIINAFLDFEASVMERGCYIADDTRRRAEDFIKE